MRDPQRLHNKDHPDNGSDMDTCWRCERARITCRSKRAWPLASIATEVADVINERNGWEPPIIVYGCPYCKQYHLSRARTNHRLKKAERRRRRLIKLSLRSEENAERLG